MLVCEKCGAVAKPNARFCVKCGGPTVNKEEAKPAEAKKESSSASPRTTSPRRGSPAPTGPRDGSSDSVKDRLKRSSRVSAPSAKGTVRRAPRSASGPDGGRSSSASSSALLAQGSKGGLTAQETAVLAKQLKDSRLRLQAAEVRAKESEAKLAKLVQAVKDDRAIRSKDYQAVLREKAEAEKRANEAEVALLNVVDSLKENERKQKERYDRAIAGTTKKAEVAVERANKMEEKLGKLLQMMKVATKSGKQDTELLSRVAELEAENAQQARQLEEMSVAMDEVQSQAKDKILDEKRKGKQVQDTVEELTQTLSSALDELKATKEELSRREGGKEGGGGGGEGEGGGGNEMKEELAKTKAKFKKALQRLKETEKRAEDAEHAVHTYEEKTEKMVEMVAQNREELTVKVATLEKELVAAKESSSAGGGAGGAGGANVDELEEKLEDAVERAEFAEKKRHQLQEKINELEEKLWATEKQLWDTEDRADDTIKKLESKVLALQEAGVGKTAAAQSDDDKDAAVELNEAQEKILVKVIKESKAKLKALEDKLAEEQVQAKTREEALQKQLTLLRAELDKLRNAPPAAAGAGDAPGATASPGGGGGASSEQLAALQARAERAEKALAAASTGGAPPPPPPVEGGMSPPPPPPPMEGGMAPPPPPPPPGAGGDFGGPPPPPPPPGPGGGPPPPPPPPGMGGPGAPPPPPGFGPPGVPAGPPPKKKMPKPSIAMKGINWQKLATRQVKGTIFEDMDETELVDQDFLPLQEVEELFATKVISAKPKDAKAAEEKPKEIVLISGKREQNVSIFLRTLKMDNDEIREAIVEMDEDILSADVLPMMIESLPTDEETTIINGWLKNNDDVDRLAKAEQFFVEINDLKSLPARLKALQYKVTFHDRVADLRPKLMQVITAIKDLSSSERFTKFIKIVLALGNFMNGRTARGGAYGFKLSTLTKLSDTKTTDNKKTLMQWIVDVLDRKDPDMLLLSDDLVAASGAANVPFSTLGSDVNMLKSGLTAMENALKKIEPGKGDRFQEVIEPAAKDCSGVCQELTDMYSSAKTDFEELATRFGEDGKKVPLEEFFGVLGTFCKQLEAAKADVLKGKEVKLRVDPQRSKMLAEIKTFEPEQLKKVEAPKNKGGGMGDFEESPNILSSIGSLATKIAHDRKERARQDIKSKKKKPQQSGRLDKMLLDLNDLDVNDLMSSGM